MPIHFEEQENNTVQVFVPSEASPLQSTTGRPTCQILQQPILHTFVFWPTSSGLSSIRSTFSPVFSCPVQSFTAVLQHEEAITPSSTPSSPPAGQTYPQETRVLAPTKPYLQRSKPSSVAKHLTEEIFHRKHVEVPTATHPLVVALISTEPFSPVKESSIDEQERSDVCGVEGKSVEPTENEILRRTVEMGSTREIQTHARALTGWPLPPRRSSGSAGRWRKRQRNCRCAGGAGQRHSC